MKNLWPEKFEPEPLPPPKILLEEQGLLLTKITGGMVQAEVSPLSDVEAVLISLQNEFNFKFSLIGPFLGNYKYTLLRLAHDIGIYPVKMAIDGSVAEELGFSLTPQGYGLVKAESPDQFEGLLKQIFQSDRVRRVVGSIIALSK